MWRILFFMVLMTPAHAAIVDEFAQEAEKSGNLNGPLSRGVNLRSIQEAFDTSKPKDSVYTCHYQAHEICKIRMREYMNTLVILPEGDNIETFDIGDTVNFEFIPVVDTKDKVTKNKYTNIGSLRTENPGADTNLNIISKNGFVYSFYIRVDDVNSIFVPDFKVYIKNAVFDTKKARQDAEVMVDVEKKEFIAAMDPEYLRSLDDINISKLEFRYKYVSGDMGLAPVNVFDDGLWTYFQYDTKNLDRVNRVPAVYKVMDGVDTPVNMRIVNGTLIAETISQAWTLRSGQAHLCVRSVDYVSNRKIEPKKTKLNGKQ